MIQARDRTFASQATSPFTDLFTTQLDGNCTGHDYPDLWFPHTEAQAAGAIEICESCPIRRDCAQSALDRAEQGVWAGVYLPRPATGPKRAGFRALTHIAAGWAPIRERARRSGGIEKLSPGQVVAAREAFAAGAATADIALGLGMSTTATQKLLLGATYRDVGGPIQTTLRRNQ